ncbi:MAG: VOC family protein [Terricaulis sp.]
MATKAKKAGKKAAKKAAKAPKIPKQPTKRGKLSAKEYSPLAPYLKVNGAKAAIDFYKKAFSAKVRMLMDAEDKKRVMHATLFINGGELMLSDEFAEFGDPATAPPPSVKTSTVSIHLQVDDADKWWARAADAGAKVVMPLADQFWGDRFGMIRDPFGHIWSIASAIKKKRK